jgi:hypothetical protein
MISAETSAPIDHCLMPRAVVVCSMAR